MGGGQWQALRLVEAQSHAGNDVTLLATKDSPLLKAASRRKLSAAPLSGARLYFAEPDIIHAHDAGSHTTAALFARTPFVVSRRVGFPLKRHALSRWKYAKPAHFLAVSEFVKRGLVEHGIADERITVVYDGVPLLEPAAAADRILTPAAKFAPAVEQAAALAGVRIERSDNLDRDLPGASLFVYWSDSEGLGSAVLLALSAGVPVVASRVGGIPEVIADGHTGLLAANTPECFAAAIRRMLDDPGFSAACAAKGREEVTTKFSVKAMADATMLVYRKVIG